MIEGKKPPVIDQRFIIRTPFKNKRTGKTTTVLILNFDGHLDVAHQMGLISLTSKIVDEWKDTIPAGTDEEGNPKVDTTWWVRVQATAVVVGPHGRDITATGFSTANDRDSFVKKPEYLLAVAETRAMKRALYNACGITEAMFNPDGKVATRESVDLPLHDDDVDEPTAIPSDVRRQPDISPPLRTITPVHPGDSVPSGLPDGSGEKSGFGFF